MLRQSNGTSNGTTANQWETGGLAALSKITAIAAQLGFLILLVKSFSLLDQAYLDVAVLVFFGFLIHASLPMRYRLAFFTLLSFASIFVILGVFNGLWLIGLGLTLIGICHLRLPFRARVFLIIGAGFLLSYLRFDWYLYPNVERVLGGLIDMGRFSVPWSAGVWPILGSMFLFRLVVYMHDLQYGKERPDIWRTLSYFFMLPNVCFPLFPVIDYARFSQDYYNEDQYRIYQRGISWIFRGITHLILYRFVYLYVALDPFEVNGLADVLQFSISTFLLYLQVSGQFHLIVGMLLLFGFNLPATNHLYYLSSSFTDHWRRINIYWKDFMMKVLYYPVYFRLRKLGNTQAIILSTLVVFFATWSLHMYQWFWLRGSLLLEWHDALFWGILGVFVVINSLYEAKHGRDRSLGKRSRTAYEIVALSFSIAATFLTISVLWGLWGSESLTQWISMWETTGMGWLAILLLIPSLFAASLLLSRYARRRQAIEPVSISSASVSSVQPKGFWRLAVSSGVIIIVCYILGQASVYSKMPLKISSVMEDIQTQGKLNDRAVARMRLGYYENLVGGVRQNPELMRIYDEQPANWSVWQPGSKRATGNMLEYEMAPNFATTFKEKKLTTNRWGMRDRNYDLAALADTHRIAILGASAVFGSGVADDDVFEAVLEGMLNNDQPYKDGVEFEILNFSKFARVALQQVMVLESKVVRFKPDTMMLFVHRNEARRGLELLARIVKNNIDVPYPFIQSVIDRAGVDSEMSRFEIEKRLLPYADELLAGTYQAIASVCREHEIVPVWVFMPITNERLEDADIAEHMAVAEATGFVVISLNDVYDEYEPDELYVAAWDDHPNALAHKLIADRLYVIIKKELFKEPNHQVSTFMQADEVIVQEEDRILSETADGATP
jgi:D-alanyl-lipoteichoic acid acyltransferase DltB (MBOAT superfamily)